MSLLTMINNSSDKQNAIHWIETNYSKIRVDELDQVLKYPGIRSKRHLLKQEKYNLVIDELKDRFIE